MQAEAFGLVLRRDIQPLREVRQRGDAYPGMVAAEEQAVGAGEVVGIAQRQRRRRDQVERDMAVVRGGRPGNVPPATPFDLRLFLDAPHQVGQHAAGVGVDDPQGGVTL